MILPLWLLPVLNEWRITCFEVSSFIDFGEVTTTNKIRVVINVVFDLFGRLLG